MSVRGCYRNGAPGDGELSGGFEPVSSVRGTASLVDACLEAGREREAHLLTAIENARTDPCAGDDRIAHLAQRISASDSAKRLERPPARRFPH